jgi:hypothetical protein
MQARSKRLDLVVVSATAIGMNQKVHAETVAIDVAENVHQPGFYAAAIHATDNMQNAHRPIDH